MKNQLYRHHKNQKLYKINCKAKDEQTGEERIIFESVNDQNPEVWDLPLLLFKKRFTPVFPGSEIADQKLFNSAHKKVIKDVNSMIAKGLTVHANCSETFCLYREEINTGIQLKKLTGTLTTIEEDVEQRLKKGLETYGNYLAPFNGRNALQDAYEEKLDELAYLAQKLMEDEISAKK